MEILLFHDIKQKKKNPDNSEFISYSQTLNVIHQQILSTLSSKYI